MKKEVLSVNNISYKTISETILNHITFSLYEGDILGIVGINAAGKSTLAKILAGLLVPSQGQVTICDDNDTSLKDTESLRNCIGYIGEETDLLLNMTVAENIILGKNEIPGIYFKQRKLKKIVEEILDKLNLNINASAIVGDMTYTQRKQVYIARQLVNLPKILIVDELTEGFSEQEIDLLYNIIQDAHKAGTSIIYTTHNYVEAMRFCNRLQVLREGMLVAEFSRPYYDRKIIRNAVYQTDTTKVANEMSVNNSSSMNEMIPIFEVRHINSEHINDASFVLNKGEILGITGFAGSGKTELAKCIGGFTSNYTGEIILHGKHISCHSPKQAIANKVCLCPEDRKEMLLTPSQSIKMNLSMMVLERISKWFFIKKKKESILAEEYCKLFNIEKGIDCKIGELNNALLAKISIAKCMVANPHILILDEPTRELDQYGVKDLCRILGEISKRCGIIITYTKFDELAEMCDRVIVLHKGRIIGELGKGEGTYNKIGKLIELEEMANCD